MSELRRAAAVRGLFGAPQREHHQHGHAAGAAAAQHAVVSATPHSVLLFWSSFQRADGCNAAHTASMLASTSTSTTVTVQRPLHHYDLEHALCAGPAPGWNV